MAVKMQWWMAVIAIVVIAVLIRYGNQGQWLSPISGTTQTCAQMGLGDGICIMSEGGRSMYSDPFKVWSGTDVPIMIGKQDKYKTFSATDIDPLVTVFNQSLALAGLGPGSKCQVKIDLASCTLGGTSSQLFDGCSGGYMTSYYPPGTKDTWLPGILVANPAGMSVSHYTMYGVTGTTIYGSYETPYVCRLTNYTYPVVGHPTTETWPDGRVLQVKAVMQTITVRIYQETCRVGDADCNGGVIKTEVLAYLDKYNNGIVTRTHMLDALQNWIDGGGQ